MPKPFKRGGKEPSGSVAEDEKQAQEILKNRSPLHVPWINPNDVTPIVVFLASDEAHMISGATFDVTAGDSAHNTA